LFGFSLTTKIFFETKLPVILQISKFASQELKYLFEIDFLKNLHIFDQGIFITKTLDILRRKKLYIVAQDFKTFSSDKFFT